MTRNRSKENLESSFPPGGGDGYEEANSIKIDFASIPEHVKEDLAAATYEAVQNTLKQPGGREMIDAIIATKRAREEAK